ncbi:L-rhamnose mutarotase [Streptomyces erythrochromogenes]|uniref:L-rhamnose mutarotase n=1 Tax=Streptomyces erythrochromogenes TaxID=285574 RepID=UPI00342E6F8A
MTKHRICFLLQVRAELADEYRERHAQVWPEMLDALRAAGWTNYSLFLRPDGLLVGYLETEDFDRAREAMSATEVNARWQEEMSCYFQYLDGTPADRAMVPLTEVFHLD